MASVRAVCVRRRDELCHLRVGGHLPLAAYVGRDDWLTGRHSLQQGDGKAFPQAGQDHQIASREQIGYILAEANELHPVSHAEMKR